jgi:hypothetical protein
LRNGDCGIHESYSRHGVSGVHPTVDGSLSCLLGRFAANNNRSGNANKALAVGPLLLLQEGSVVGSTYGRSSRKFLYWLGTIIALHAIWDPSSGTA